MTKVKNIKVKDAEQVKANTELIQRKELKETPFVIVSLTETNEHFGTLGEYRITEKYDKFSKVETELSKITWNRLIQVIMIITDKLNQKQK